MAQSDFYGYLFQSDKKPTKVLDALLRGIANYISDSVGNKEEKALTPAKLACFYKAVGGNYDSLFVDVPSPSISWIYASIGCQHTLQPKPEDDFQPPAIPALTTRGFVRWQSIEILLGPEEHVPFIQTAVRNFEIKNPDTGETFPVDLPTEAFPIVPDKAIEKWHNSCAEKLRQRASPNEEEARPDLPPRPKVRTGFSHVRPEQTRDYFEPKYRSRPIPYQHVPGAGPVRPVRPKLSQSPTHQARQFLAPEAPLSPYNRGRRRSVPENNSPSSSPFPTNGSPPTTTQPPNIRRHSHPRHARRRGSVSSDASSSSEGDGRDDTVSPRSPMNVNYVPGVAAGVAAGLAGAAAASSRRKSHPNSSSWDDPPIIRFAPPPPNPQGAPVAAPTPSDPRPRRRISRERAAEALNEEAAMAKRQGGAIPIDPTGKLSAPFLLGKRGNGERVRRGDSKGPTVTWKDLSDVPLDPAWRRGSKSSEEDRTDPKISRIHSRHESERDVFRKASKHESDRERDREKDSGSSGSRRRRERDRDGDGDAGRPRLRERRHSSLEDVTRRHRDRERDHDRERESVGGGFRDRDREKERRVVSPVRGVDGRKYPPAR